MRSLLCRAGQVFWFALFATVLTACSLDFEQQAVLESDGDGPPRADSDGQIDLEDGKDQAEELATDSVDAPELAVDTIDTDDVDLLSDQADTAALDGTDSGDETDSADAELDVLAPPPTCGWTDATDLGGADWVVGVGELIGGRFMGINRFVVPLGTTANVVAWDNAHTGRVEICARFIEIEGELSAVGSGGWGGYGGTNNQNGELGYGNAPGSGGDTGTKPAASCNSFTEAPHPAGGNGGTGQVGEYAVPPDSSTDDLVWLGSGGGGGGGGGKGGSATCCGLTADGGAGGQGGQGGSGGGAIVLVASERLTINGTILANGRVGSSGASGAAGAVSQPNDSGCPGVACGSCADHRYALCPSACNDRECCYNYRGGTGGTGGPGAAGSGGGIYLQAPTIELTGLIQTLNGEGDALHGGTVKLRTSGPTPDHGRILAGRIDP